MCNVQGKRRLSLKLSENITDCTVDCDSQGKFCDFLTEPWSSAEHSFGIP